MTKKWIAINLMLLAAAGLLGWQLYKSVKRFRDENNIARLTRMQPVRKKTGSESKALPVRNDTKINETDFMVIPDQNLFADTRKREEKVVDTPVVEAPRKLDIVPVLVGITISGSQRNALIKDPAAAAGPGARPYQTIRLGDHYRGFVVTDINDNNMVLEYGSSREVIPLYDTSKPPGPSGKTQILATRIVNFGPASGAATATALVQNARAVAAGVPVPVQQGNPAASRGSGTGVAQRPIAGPGNIPQAGGAGTGVSPGPTWNSQIDRQGNIIVNSPFGPFTLPNTTNSTPPVKK